MAIVYSKISKLWPTPEKAFNISSCYENYQNDLENYSSAANNADEDSISSMRDALTDASDHFDEAQAVYANTISSLDEWRDLAIYFWELIENEEIKKEQLNTSLPENKQKELEKIFNLEVLKKL